MEVSKLCFICFREVSLNSIEIPNSGVTTTQENVHGLGRKFAKSSRQYFSLDDPHHGSEDVSTSDDDFGAVCSECAPRLEQFCEMHTQLQDLQKRMNAKVEEIWEAMTKAERENDKKEEFETYQRLLQLQQKRRGQNSVDVSGFRKDFLERVQLSHDDSTGSGIQNSSISSFSPRIAPADFKVARKNEDVTSKSHSMGHPSTASIAEKSLLDSSLSNGKTPTPKRKRSSRRIRLSDYQKQCMFCSKYFRSFTLLEWHIYSHSKEKWYACKICGNEFSQRCHLVIHRRVHTGERLYKCEICEKRLTTRWVLENHIRVHTLEKPFKCRFCKRGFAQLGHRNSHEKIHEGRLTK